MQEKRIRIILFLFLILNFVLAGCTSSNNKIVKEVNSPDGKYTAIYFVRDLGATTQKSYQLTVLNKGKKLRDTGGNILISYWKFDLQWKGDKLLVVNIKSNDEVFKQLTQYKEIKIEYQED